MLLLTVFFLWRYVWLKLNSIFFFSPQYEGPSSADMQNQGMLSGSLCAVSNTERAPSIANQSARTSLMKASRLFSPPSPPDTTPPPLSLPLLALLLFSSL